MTLKRIIFLKNHRRWILNSNVNNSPLIVINVQDINNRVSWLWVIQELSALSLQLFLKSSKMKVYLKIVEWKQPWHPVMDEQISVVCPYNGLSFSL